ncbi:alpha amylase C-terminal domain-containing protein, partial [Bordetella hinzii]|nr:alpha amylase C-terminal domain-containing protein [Bordetella hinzii]
HDRSVDWALLDEPGHRGVQRTVRALNQLYASLPALHAGDADPAGFAWVILDDTDNSVLAFERHAAGHAPVLAVCNFTPVRREDYRVGACRGGAWRVLLDSGADEAPAARPRTTGQPAHGRADSLVLALPGMTTLLLTPDHRES